MSFLDKVRYRLGRWAALGKASESSLGNKAEWTSAFQQPSGPLLITKEAGDDAIAQNDDPGKQQHDKFGTEL